MKLKFAVLVMIISLPTQYSLSQNIEPLDSITIQSTRIDLPFKKAQEQ